MDQDVIEALCRKASGPIVWGVNDCVPLCADYFRERVGVDLMEGFRGYETRDQRDATMWAAGGFLRAVLGRIRKTPELERVDPDIARDPAFGLAKVQGFWVVALCTDTGFWITKHTAGVTMIPDSDIARAWTWA